MTGQAEHGINRRDFLRVGAALVGKFAIDAAFPRPSKAEAPSDWNPILIRQGDTFPWICGLYGFTSQNDLNEIAKLNGIPDSNLIFAGNSLYLPKSEKELINCFCQLYIQIDNGDTNKKTIASLSAISNVDDFNKKVTSESVFHHGINWPGVFFGHSAVNRENSNGFPFDTTLRQIIEIKEKDLLRRVMIKAARPLGLQSGGNWVEANAVKVGFYSSVGEFIDSLPQNIYYNSHHLILVTCATESKYKNNRIYVCAEISDYSASV